MVRLRTALVYLARALLAASGLHASPWREQPADLPLDPALHLGALPNGLRFAVLPNHEPKNRVSLRLLVSVGSLHERERERGLAHFIEHMAFRGTKKYPRSTLVPALEKMGMGLGPDTAAFTGYEYTVFQLELPDASAATIQYGLDVFREFAENITFSPSDIVTERGVIFSEMAARDTGGYRWDQYNTAFLWPSSLRALRSPIGTVASLNAFRHRDFQAFYDAWYRPERIAVLVVGEVSPAVISAQIRQTFRSLRARSAPRPEPPDLRPARASASHVVVWADPALVGVNVVLEHPTPDPQSDETRAARIARMREFMAMAMFQRRLRLMAHRPDASFLEGTAYLDTSVPGWSNPVISVTAKTQQLNGAATEADQEFRRAFLYGFTPEELNEVKADYRSSLLQLVQTAATRSSATLAGQIAHLLLYGRPFSSPATVAADQSDGLEQTTLADCRQAFRTVWSAQAPHVVVGLNPQNDIPASLVAGLMNDSRAVPVQPRANEVVAPFPYGDFGPAGRLKNRSQLADLNVTLAEFSNGVRLNLKPTDFEAKTIEFTVRVGAGKQSMPPVPALDYFADYGLIPGGLNRCSSEQLESLLAGHPIALGFQVANDACCFYGRCSPAELKFTLAIIAAFLTDPGFRAEELKSVRGAAEARLTTLRSTSGGLVDLNAESYITDFDPRLVPGAEQDIEKRTYGELAGWLAPELTGGAVEIGLVGDLKVEDAIAAAASSLGALPPRPAPAPPSWKPVRYAASHPRFILGSSWAIKDNCVAVIWPAPAVEDVGQERRCWLLSAVLKERLMNRLRDELGATYTPEVGFVFDQGLPGHNYFEAKVAVSRGHAERAEQIILEEATALGRHPVDPEAFERARRPVLRERDDELRSNSYWLYAVLGDVQQHPERIANARSREADFASITAAELTPFAARYLRRENAFEFLTVQGVATTSSLHR